MGKPPSWGKKETGKADDVNFTDTRIHEVKLIGLKRFTNYYYRVRTGKLVSDIFQFKTSPFASDNKSFNILAMSDMQKDHQNPDKFKEIVNEGIILYLKQEYGNNLPDDLEKKRYKYFKTLGVPVDKEWTPENSFLVFNISKDKAKRLCKEFEQNAFVYGSVYSEAELVWVNY